MDVPVTPDNTRVVKLMGDFREFMMSAQQQSRHSQSYMSRSAIPFNISTEENAGITPSSKPVKRSHAAEQEALSKAKIAHIELKHARDEKEHNLARLALEERVSKLMSENKILKEKNSSLQSQVKEVTLQAIEAQDELQEIRSQRSSKSNDLEDSILELEKDKADRESDLETKITELETHCDELREQNSFLALQNSVLDNKLEETTTLLARKTNRVEKLTEDLKEFQNTESTVGEQRIKIQELEMRLSRAAESEMFAKAVKDDLERLRQLELEVVKLREWNEIYQQNESNVLLMKEKVMAAEAKLERNEKMLEKAAVLELENKELLQQLNEAKSHELQLMQNQDMSELIELRRKEALFANERGQMQTELSLLNNKCERYDLDITELKKVITEQTELIKTKDAEFQNLHKQAIFLKGECNGLRGILQSYDSEMATTSHAEQLMKRSKTLEASNEKLLSQLLNTQKMAQASSEEAAALRVKLKNLEEQHEGESNSHKIIDQKKEIETLQKKVEELESDKANLVRRKEKLELWAQQNIRRGDFDPSVTKVFHFKMNPADLAHKEAKLKVVELEQKCRKLQEKILKLEADQDVTTTCLDTATTKELEEKLSMSELKNQRLKEVFSKKIQEFRRACYTLTGYRIDGINDDHFKLTSRYAETENDYLLFSSDSSGGLQLLETDYSKTLTNLIELHLHHQNSIPMFLSSLTAELFGQQTVLI